MSLKKQAIKGTMWTTGSLAVQVLIATLRLSILTRYLAPADFGLVAIVTVVLGFTHIFADLGVSVSLFSRDKITINEYSSLYWVAILLGVILYMLLCGSAPLISHFYKMPELKKLIPFLGLDLIIATAGRQFKIFKQKELKFKDIAIIEIIANISSLLIATFFASKGYGVYSLIYSTLFASLLTTILLIATSLKSHPVKLYVNFKESKSFYRIGMFQTGAQILDYIASQMDVILIGKLMTPTDLGIFNLVKQLIMRVYAFVNPIITTVSIPILVRLKEQYNQFKEKYLTMINMIAFGNIFLYGILACTSREVINILYGPKYMVAAPIMAILCCWGSVVSFSGGASSVIVIFGRTDIGFRWTLIRIALDPLFVITGFKLGGMEGIVIAQAIYSIVVLFIYKFYVLDKLILSINLKEYIGYPAKYFLTALIITIGLLFIGLKINLNIKWVYIILIALATAFIYCTLFLLMNRKSAMSFYRFLKK